MSVRSLYITVLFFNFPATTSIYTLSLHDALPIFALYHAAPMLANARGWQVLLPGRAQPSFAFFGWMVWVREAVNEGCARRSEEHTSELQSQFHLVCRLLLEKKKNNRNHLEWTERN